jgi:hypothetical protein
LHRARKRFDAYAATLTTDRAGHRSRMGALLELCVVPNFPALQVCKQEDLKSFIQKSWKSWRGVMFPDPGQQILTQQESAIVLGAARGLSFFEANTWGMLYYLVRIDEDHNGTPGIHIRQFVGYLLLFVRHAGQMLGDLGYFGSVRLSIELRSLLRVQWLDVSRGNWFNARPGSELDDDLPFSIATTSETLISKPDLIVRELLRFIFFSVNWSELVDSQDKLEKLIREGHEFNRY